MWYVFINSFIFNLQLISSFSLLLLSKQVRSVKASDECFLELPYIHKGIIKDPSSYIELKQYHICT